MNQLRNQHQGFTLIELMLSMTFISLLLLAIAMTTIQVSHIYTKGVTFRSVNQAGRTIGADLQQDAASSSPFDVYKPGTQTVLNGCGSSPRYVRQCNGGVESGGRLCMGSISYVWNYGTFLNSGTGPNQYAGGSTPVRFVRVSDPGGQLCLDSSTKVNQSAATELLGGKDSLDLALHSFTIATSRTASDQPSGQQMYAISFTIGTNEQNALMTNDTQCVPPQTTSGSGESDWEYCAVNTFTIVVRAGNQP